MEKGYTKQVLDKGFVRLIDWMGSDQRICESARISYRAPSKGVDQDKKLIQYLYKNHHCYHPDMQVLTILGWKNWKDCNEEEYFAVPNPQTKKISFEKLKLLKFRVENEEMCGFRNGKMSYLVTSNHRMWFQSKQNQRLKNNKFEIFEAKDLLNWGHFECANNYDAIFSEGLDEYFKFIGFYLGDGFLVSKNILSFRFCKERKIKYLKSILKNLNIPYKLEDTKKLTSANNKIYQFYINRKYFANHEKYFNPENKTNDKSFNRNFLIELSNNQKQSLLDGLINSDGSIKKNRPQIEYSSNSYELILLVEGLGSIFGYDAHQCKKIKNNFHVKLYKRCSKQHLEARKQYFFNQNYSGDVYCTTSSTGLLIVRGTKEDYSFICGNSSPFEQCNATFNIKLPLFVQAQLIRHRTARVNQVSARYTEMKEEFYVPTEWRQQDTKNKQGSIFGKYNEEDNELLSFSLEKHNKECYNQYKYLLNLGVAREMARMVLPQNLYTEIYWNIDLNNLLKFFRLRDDSHAQYEIQEYAKVMKEISRELFPWTLEAYDKFKWKVVEES